MSNTACESGIFSVVSATDFDNDEILVAGMLRNHPAAWSAFVTRFERLVLRCISKVTRRFAAVVSQDDVREIAATFYVSILANDMKKLRSFDPARGSKLSSWIGLLAINTAYDYLRSLKREPQKEALFEASDIVSDSPDPFELTSEHERASITQATLADFSEKDRAFAALYFGEGMDPRAIAERLDISVNTVYSKKHKIQSRLESALGRLAA